MAKAKTPRTITPTNKQVLTMPEAGSLPQIRKSAPLATSTIDLESQVRQRAYELYQERGCAPGHENDDWFQAEREIHNRKGHLQSA